MAGVRETLSLPVITLFSLGQVMLINPEVHKVFLASTNVIATFSASLHEVTD